MFCLIESILSITRLTIKLFRATKQKQSPPPINNANNCPKSAAKTKF